MENLLYKAKGLKKSHSTIMTVCSVVMIVISIALIFISQMKRSSYKATISTLSGQTVSSGNLGGGYIIDKDARSTMIIFAVVIIVLALLFFESVIFSNKSYISVFDNHVEAMLCVAFLVCIKKPLNVTYDKISDVQFIAAPSALSTDKIVILTQDTKFIVVANNSQKAYQIIKDKIS